MNAKSKVTIQIDLECDPEDLEANLNLLIEQLKKAGKGTDLFYAATSKPLKSLLRKIVKKIPAKSAEDKKIPRENKSRKNTFSLGSWEGAISLDATNPRPISPEPGQF
jgi:hypothetical protein